MKTIVQSLYASPKFAKAVEWGKLVSITGSSQLLIQVISFTCGILVIRLLPSNEYALYTIANTMLGTILVLADGGISTGVMSEGSKVWNDKMKLGIILSTGLDLRKKFAFVTLLIAVPILLLLLRQHNASWTISILILLALVPAFVSSLSGSVLEIIPKLHQDIFSLQKIQVGANIGRLVFVILALFVFPFAFVAVIAAGLPQVFANIKLRKRAYSYTSLPNHTDKQVEKKLLKVVKKILPGSIYYCLSGQITIWLISIFGTTESLAQIGALGRLTMAINLFSVLFITLVVPRFAKLPNIPNILMKRFFQLVGMLILISSAIVCFVLLFPDQVLWILGSTYSGLTTEILIMTIGSCIGMVVGIIYSSTISRGLILSPIINISGHIITQIAFLSFVNISTTANFLWLSVADCSIAFVMLTSNFIYKTIVTSR